MFYIIGLIRSTSLYALILFIISLILGKTDSNDILLTIGCIYPLAVLIHQLIIKIKERKKYSFTDSYFSSLGADLGAPFRHTFTFFLIITRKHIIRDKSKFYNMIDFIEVVAGFICTIIIVVIGLITFL